ncbi:MAG: DUF2490 domain-containing protein [Lentimicrobium sp.]|jgi:hypothetical protein|nr:DUF2490 domain-containing protein [Lentimicrobium sp.]
MNLVVSAQEGTYVEVRDIETWSSVGLQLKLNKKWEFGLREQMQLKSNSTMIDSYFTNIDVKYVGLKRWELGGGFRFLRENDTKGTIQGFENHTRYHLDLSYKHTLNRMDFVYRLRYQNKNELGVGEEEGDFANRHLRLKAGVGYNFKDWKLDPKFSTEIYRHYEHGEENGFDKIRFTIGTDYKIKKAGEIELFYRIEKDLGISYPKTTHIFGLSYRYTFKITTNED